ncbi:30S ribosomal protein S20 [Actinomarinicola tropica]|uniref:Small ribosomal subunit protein bS20 n=1 Tax=Actinomarinicola tropica TaxID=2789776 RepID=A0A5Q2RL68_9ACTN|nr:30S ribosomal protein S20 [Actinomarinicola tropica]QGG95672.1 30S ribosomal protein S20 [Actinomarinicola tropica]
MANIASQKKRNRQNEKRRLRNKAVRAELKTRQKKAETAATNGAEDAEATYRLAIKRIDQAAAKGVLHKNAANRKKSRLTKRLAKLSAGE